MSKYLGSLGELDMRSKIALRKMIRKLILAGYWSEAERLMQEMQGEITYYNRQGGIKRIDEEFFAKDSKVVSLAEYRRLKELTSE